MRGRPCLLTGLDLDPAVPADRPGSRRGRACWDAPGSACCWWVRCSLTHSRCRGRQCLNILHPALDALCLRDLLQPPHSRGCGVPSNSELVVPARPW